MECRIGYVIVGVKSLEAAIPFYRDTMGFEFQFSEPECISPRSRSAG
jgi:catechol 2,3-dioxygenase-like lactoylglutathione lyase family enzyme